MNCPTCKKSEHLHAIGTLHIWCSSCGSFIEKHGDGSIRRINVPASPPHGPGLISVAAEAVHRANRKLLGFPQDALGQAGVRETFEDITEAISAILHELEARDIETSTPHDATSCDRVLAKAIADGVVGIERERERCATLVENRANGETSETDRLLHNLAAAIRKVPRR